MSMSSNPEIDGEKWKGQGDGGGEAADTGTSAAEWGGRDAGEGAEGEGRQDERRGKRQVNGTTKGFVLPS